MIWESPNNRSAVVIAATITQLIQSMASPNDHIGVASLEWMLRRPKGDVYKRTERHQMILNLFDSADKPDHVTIQDGCGVCIVPNHGPLGLSHAARVEVDYEYQIEQWVFEIGKDHPEIVRAECEDLKRKWKRDSDKTFAEVPW